MDWSDFIAGIDILGWIIVIVFFAAILALNLLAVAAYLELRRFRHELLTYRKSIIPDFPEASTPFHPKGTAFDFPPYAGL